MKKFLSLTLVLAMALALAAPATAAAPTAAAAPNGFATGDVTQIDKKGYDSFSGKEITSNNSVAQFSGFNFVADNKTFNAWYVDVFDELKGTLEVAYKISANYYTVVFHIEGAGKYWIGDSKGGNGINMVKIGAYAAHVHDYQAVVTPPGCEEDGYTTYTCACGDSYIDDIVAALGHDWDDGVVTKPAGCEEDGVMTYTCTRDGCGETYTEAIPAIGHDYVALPYHHGDGFVVYECKNCGDTYTRATKTEIGWVSMYSNADGVNAVGTYYKQDDDAGVWNNVINYGTPRHFTVPTVYDDTGFHNEVPAQFIWDAPSNEVSVGDSAVLEFNYDLPDALSRKVIDYWRDTGGGVGFELFYTGDGKFSLLVNDKQYVTNLNTLLYSEEELASGRHVGVTEGPFTDLIEDPATTALNLKFSALNTLDYGSKSGQAMIIFAGAMAYEYDVFAD